MERSLRTIEDLQSIAGLRLPERVLSSRDATLARVIVAQPARWPSVPTEEPIWGLIRMVLAQQITTHVACRLAERVRSEFPMLVNRSTDVLVPDVVALRAVGLPARRAQCCIEILRESENILASVREGCAWEEALAGIKGIGPWTISVFRIMVLRDPDEFPARDIGLQRAIMNVYGRNKNIERLSENWRPFRSVACWYLWRTLGNEQLG